MTYAQFKTSELVHEAYWYMERLLSATTIQSCKTCTRNLEKIGQDLRRRHYKGEVMDRLASLGIDCTPRI